MAKLTAAGIYFPGDATTVEKRTWIFPSGTYWVFYQAAAPTGWTKQTTHDNKALRLVSGTGGGSGGTQPFTTVCSPTFAYAGTLNTTTATGPRSLDSTMIPSHSHDPFNISYNAVPAIYNPDGSFNSWNGGDVARNPGWSRITPGASPAGSGSVHNHPVSASGPVNTTFSLGVQYMNVIVCSFNG